MTRIAGPPMAATDGPADLSEEDLPAAVVAAASPAVEDRSAAEALREVGELPMSHR